MLGGVLVLGLVLKVEDNTQPRLEDAVMKLVQVFRVSGETAGDTLYVVDPTTRAVWSYSLSVGIV